MSQQYRFRRLDNDEVITVSFEEMMERQVNGLLEVDDGNGGYVYARRIHDKPLPPKSPRVVELNKPIVSDSLGFMTSQLADFERDRIAHGFHDIEFKPDPVSPGVMQAHIGSQRTLRRYLKHRGMVDKNSRNGSKVILTAADLETGRKLVLDRYGETDGSVLVEVK